MMYSENWGHALSSAELTAKTWVATPFSNFVTSCPTASRSRCSREAFLLGGDPSLFQPQILGLLYMSTNPFSKIQFLVERFKLLHDTGPFPQQLFDSDCEALNPATCSVALTKVGWPLLSATCPPSEALRGETSDVSALCPPSPSHSVRRCDVVLQRRPRRRAYHRRKGRVRRSRQLCSFRLHDC